MAVNCWVILDAIDGEGGVIVMDDGILELLDFELPHEVKATENNNMYKTKKTLIVFITLFLHDVDYIIYVSEYFNYNFKLSIMKVSLKIISFDYN